MPNIRQDMVRWLEPKEDERVHAQVWFVLSDVGFFSNRVFPTPGIGTKAGWHYTYPVHEVGPCQQLALPVNDTNRPS